MACRRRAFLRDDGACHAAGAVLRDSLEPLLPDLEEGSHHHRDEQFPQVVLFHFLIVRVAIRVGADRDGYPQRRGRNAIQSRSHLRSEEHTSELQSLMRISYAVFCLKKKKK